MNLLLSVDWHLLLAFTCLELILYFVHAHREGGPLLAPRRDCIARSGKDHWVVGSGRVRHP